MTILFAFLAAQAAAAMPVPAPHPVPALPCTTDAALPPALAFWTQPGTGADLKLFRPLVLTTAAPGAPAPAKPGRVAGIGFTVAEAGAYTVALGGPGWIDVVPGVGGKPLESIAHGHGPDCTTIRKLVTFRLVPGAYRLQLSGLAAASIKVALVPGSPTPAAAK